MYPFSIYSIRHTNFQFIISHENTFAITLINQNKHAIIHAELGEHNGQSKYTVE